MKKYISLFFCIFLGNLFVFSQNDDKDYTSDKIIRYHNAAIQVSFVPLEIGEITPQGWLQQWANKAVKGITGHLDEYQDVFKNGWKGFGFKARGTNPKDGTGWPIEQCSYWLDGAVKLAFILRDTTLMRKTTDRLNLVVDGVLRGSDTFIYWKPKTIVNDNFNNWGHGLMGRALVSYYQATHNPRVLQALVKVYKQYPLPVPSSRQLKSLNSNMNRFRGSTNIDAMTETYLMSGERAIIDSIIIYSKKANVIKSEKFWQSLNASKATTESEDVHGVSFYEAMRVPAMMFLWTGNKQELETTKHILSWAETKNLLPYGVCSSEENLSGIGCFRSTETCNVPTSMWSFLWMLRLTGESRWCDKIERIFFNAGPAPIARDFKTMSYYQSPNRLNTLLPEAPPVPPGKGSMKFTKFGDEVLCCVGNCNNILPDYISNMWMGTMDGGLAFVLYGPCCVQKNIKGKEIKINCNSQYPFNDKVKVKFSLKGSVNMPIYFRVPQWCKHAFISVNSKKVAVVADNGFIRISRIWRNNDNVILTFPMSLNIEQQHETEYPNTEYFKSRTKYTVNTFNDCPFEYITYGPLLFSLPLKDVNPNVSPKDSTYNYALDVNLNRIDKDIIIVKKPVVRNWSWRIEDAPISLKVKAKMIDWKPTQWQPLPKVPIANGKDTDILLLPYGCTKFRVTMFPVTNFTWKN
jgi:hypothetical protein